MSHFRKEHDNHDSTQVPLEELLEALEVFQVIPPEHRTVYLMHRAGIAFPQIAKTMMLDIDDAELQYEEAENALYHWAAELIETNSPQPLAKKFQSFKPGQRDAILEFLSDIILKLLFFDETDSPPPQLEEFATIIIWVRKTLGFYVLQDRQIESANVLSAIPHMTPPEMRIADQWLFSLDASTRETIMLSHVADMAPPQIAEIQGISETEASIRIVEAENLQQRYTLDLLTRWLETKRGYRDTKALSPDEAKTAKLLWKRLGGQFREILHKWLLDDGTMYFDTAVYEPEREEEEKNFEVAENFLRSYFGLLVTGWCQIALNGMRDENTVRIAAARKTLQHKRLLRNSDSIAFAIRLLDFEVREAFLLSWSLEPQQIARYQNTTPVFVDLRIREAWMVLQKRFEWIVTQWFRRRSNESDAIKLRPSEKIVAQKIVKKIPKRYRAALGQSLLTNHSNYVIAKDLGLPVKTVARYVATGKEIISNLTTRLTCEYFSRAHKGIPVAEKFLNEMYLQKRRHEPKRDGMTPDQRKNAILDELKTVLSDIPIDDLAELRAGRVTFFLTRGCGVNIDEIPDFYGNDATYLRKACGKVVKHLHREVESHVRERLQQINPFLAPPGTGAIGSQAMKAVSREQLEIYRRHHVAGELEREIAEAFSVSEDVVSKTLAATKKRFHEIVEEFMTVLLNHPLEYRPEFQALNQDIRTAQTTLYLVEQARAVKGKTLEIPASGVASLGITEPIPDIPIESSLQKTLPTRSVISRFSWRDTIASVPKLLTPLFGLPTFDSVSKTLWGTVSNAFMFVAIPFLWVMSLAISGQALGYAFVRNAPTLGARRWIIKQLFWCYALIFVVSMGALNLVGLISKYASLNKGQTTDLSVIAVLILAVVFIYEAVQIAKARKYWKSHSHSMIFEQNSYLRLESFIHWGLGVTGILLLVFYGYIFLDNTLPLLREGRIAYGNIFLGGTLGVIYLSSLGLFRHFLEISKDETAFQNTSPLPVNERRVRRFSEFLYVFPFAFFPVATGVGHIYYNNFRPVLTSIEMLISTICWVVIWYWNVQSSQRRGLKILGGLTAWVVITRILRHIVYPMFF